MLNYNCRFFFLPVLFIFLFSPAGICESIGEEKADILITSVEVKGNRRLAEEEILSLIKTKTGQSFNQSTLTEDLKTLYRQGWFCDVGIDTEDYQGGKKVIFIVKEKPLIKQLIFYLDLSPEMRILSQGKCS